MIEAGGSLLGGGKDPDSLGMGDPFNRRFSAPGALVEVLSALPRARVLEFDIDLGGMSAVDVVLIIGPPAVGKMAVGLALCERTVWRRGAPSSRSRPRHLQEPSSQRPVQQSLSFWQLVLQAVGPAHL